MIIAFLAEAPEVCDHGQARADLLTAHQSFIEAHLEDDIALWRTLEAETLHSVSGGLIQEEGDDRWTQRQAYLDAVEFTHYADERTPHIRIADDCSMAWMTVQVRVEGHPLNAQESAFASVFAWVYLWENSGGQWQLEGVVSTGAAAE